MAPRFPESRCMRSPARVRQQAREFRDSAELSTHQYQRPLMFQPKVCLMFLSYIGMSLHSNSCWTDIQAQTPSIVQ